MKPKSAVHSPHNTQIVANITSTSFDIIQPATAHSTNININ